MIIALVFSLFFIVSAPAQAADWSDGKFDCNITVTEVAPSHWWIFWQWGLWSKLDASFYLIRKPQYSAVSVTVGCQAERVGDKDSDEFSCRAPRNLFTNDFDVKLHFTVQLKRGLDKTQACQAIHDASSMKWQNLYGSSYK